VYSEPSKRWMRAGRDRAAKATPLNWLFETGSSTAVAQPASL
jgi:hypothetical protein